MATKTFFVTGCSSGVGKACALQLAGEGHRVFASVRKESDATALRSAGVEVIFLDTADSNSISKAVLQLESLLGPYQGLDGLVNNAGMVVAGPLEVLTPAQIQQQFAVNVFGPLELIQKTLPLLKKNKGRIVNVGSIMGRTVWPFSGAYVASKHALAGMSDSLGLEMAPFGIKVVLLEPAAIATSIWDKVFSQTSELQKLLGNRPDWKIYSARGERIEKSVRKAVRSAVSAEYVCNYIHKALFHANPPPRYLVGPSAKMQAFLQKFLPNRWFVALIGKIT